MSPWRRVLTGVLGLAALTSLLGVQDCRTGPVTPTDGPLPLAEVTFWAYQIQGLAAAGAVDALASARYDMVVVDPTETDWGGEGNPGDFDATAMAAKLKGSAASDGSHRKLVLAYIDIG